MPGQPSRAKPRRRRRAPNRIGLLVLAICLAAAVLWADSQPGGLSGTVERGMDWVDARLDDLTGADDVDETVSYLNDRYDEVGAYPHLSESDRLDIEGIDLTGVRIEHCSDHHIVVKAFTARGTQSSLLVAGESWGKVTGDAPCPTDLDAPFPWTSPEAVPADSNL